MCASATEYVRMSVSAGVSANASVSSIATHDFGLLLAFVIRMPRLAGAIFSLQHACTQMNVAFITYMHTQKSSKHADTDADKTFRIYSSHTHSFTHGFVVLVVAVAATFCAVATSAHAHNHHGRLTGRDGGGWFYASAACAYLLQ